MTLRLTREMKTLWDKIEPYLDEHLQLADNAPDEVKKASDEFKRLSKEQEESALRM